MIQIGNDSNLEFVCCYRKSSLSTKGVLKARTPGKPGVHVAQLLDQLCGGGDGGAEEDAAAGCAGNAWRGTKIHNNT